jgi:uncharacterized protein (DUF2252 family)
MTAPLRNGWLEADDAQQAGRDLRKVADHDAHAEFSVAADRPSVAEFMNRSNEGRLEDLVPLRHQRMAATAFAFYRGTAGMMACDLAHSPSTGVTGQICGDAHSANFGLYGTDDGRIVMDINDFDETVIGPWEWDLKRLAASLVLAGREAGAPEDVSAKAARHAAKAYRRETSHLAGLPFLTSWSALGDEATISRASADELLDDFGEAAEKALRNTSEKVANKITNRTDDGKWEFVANPPVLTTVDDATEAAVLDGMPEYIESVRGPRRTLLSRFRPCDVAMRVVGTGSVGLRAYVVLMEGNGGEALVLQVKQSQPSALAPYVEPGEDGLHEGHRIVRGARLVQAETDILFGYTTIDGLPYIVRQFRNRKGEIDPAELSRSHLDDYGRLAGALLARAHARSIDPRILAGYGKNGKPFDKAIARFAVAYADQVQRDHQEFLDAISDGTLP